MIHPLEVGKTFSLNVTVRQFVEHETQLLQKWPLRAAKAVFLEVKAINVSVRSSLVHIAPFSTPREILHR